MKKQKPKIVISKELKSILDSLGTKGDTYEGIIWNLIKKVKETKNEN